MLECFTVVKMFVNSSASYLLILSFSLSCLFVFLWHTGMFLSHKVDMKHSGFKGSCNSGVRLPIKNSELLRVRGNKWFWWFVCLYYLHRTPEKGGETEDIFFVFFGNSRIKAGGHWVMLQQVDLINEGLILQPPDFIFILTCREDARGPD